MRKLIIILNDLLITIPAGVCLVMAAFGLVVLICKLIVKLGG